jgi:hypothetical protein
MNHRRRDHSLVGVALSALLSGCATDIQGSGEPPFDWVADDPSSQCMALSGSYRAVGMPAPSNAHAANYGAVWPTEGLLISIIERGTNGIPRKRPRWDPVTNPMDIVPSITVIVDAAGSVRFAAKNWSGGDEKLRPQAWNCERGALTSLVSLGSADYESYVRLWKHDDALIAEQTIRETDAGANGARAHRPVARFHFRFPSTMD